VYNLLAYVACCCHIVGTDGSMCERAHVEWRLCLSQLCDDLTTHLSSRLHSMSHSALKQDEESLAGKSAYLPHVAVDHSAIPDHPRRVLQVVYTVCYVLMSRVHNLPHLILHYHVHASYNVDNGIFTLPYFLDGQTVTSVLCLGCVGLA